MRVNADGARRAYQVDNHGISYLCDGLTARHGSSFITRNPCASITSSAMKLAEVENNELHFSAEGPELCIFGFDVVGGRKGVPGCRGGSVVGGGHSRAKAPLVLVPSSDVPLHYFVSMTALENKNDDVTKRWIDSERVPFIVIPSVWLYSNIRLGDYAYVYSPGELGIKQEELRGPRGSYSIVADIGPRDKFGEGSIALHQMLVFGELRPAPAYQKTDSGERHPGHASIYHPYRDTGDGDVRAKGNISRDLWYILFPESRNDSIAEHSFSVENTGAPAGNVYTEGRDAAGKLGGHDHIISCLKGSPHFD